MAKQVVKEEDGAGFGGFLTVSKFRGGALVGRTAPMRNKVVSSEGYGRNLILRKLCGDVAYAIEIDSCALGDSGTAATDGDTGLGNETVGPLDITSKNFSNDQMIVEVFVPDANLANGTYREFGLFIDGQMFCRVVISPDYTKASGEDTLFSYTLNATG